MRKLARAFGVAAFFAIVRAARADVETPEPTTLEEAQHAFDAATVSWAAAGTDCVTMCRALQSMARAADRLCALTPPGDEPAQHRCEEARAKVAEATKKVLAACPACNPTPPGGSADQTTTKTPEKPAEPTTAPPPPREKNESYVLAGLAESEYAPTTSSFGPRVTVAFSPLWLAWQPYFVDAHVEARIVGPISLLVRGGVGSLARVSATSDAPASGRVFVWRLGGGVRSYLGGANGSASSGAFVALESQWDDAKDPIASLHVVPGLTIDPLVGYKWVAANGFTIETQVGASIVAVDRRTSSLPRPAAVATWDIALGYSF